MNELSQPIILLEYLLNIIFKYKTTQKKKEIYQKEKKLAR